MAGKLVVSMVSKWNIVLSFVIRKEKNIPTGIPKKSDYQLDDVGYFDDDSITMLKGDKVSLDNLVDTLLRQRDYGMIDCYYVECLDHPQNPYFKVFFVFTVDGKHEERSKEFSENIELFEKALGVLAKSSIWSVDVKNIPFYLHGKRSEHNRSLLVDFYCRAPLKQPDGKNVMVRTWNFSTKKYDKLPLCANQELKTDSSGEILELG